MSRASSSWAARKWALPLTELLVRAPPRSSAVVRSPVTVSMTSGPVTNMCEAPSTITVKSVIEGE